MLPSSAPNHPHHLSPLYSVSAQPQLRTYSGKTPNLVKTRKQYPATVKEWQLFARIRRVVWVPLWAFDGDLMTADRTVDFLGGLSFHTGEDKSLATGILQYTCGSSLKLVVESVRIITL
jgi:hypothetical protein